MQQDSLLKTRIQKRNQRPASHGQCVLYVMSRDQRVHDNHALLAAQKHALALDIPLAVVFCLQAKTGYRTREQYEWMISGLYDVEATLAKHNIPLITLLGDPAARLAGVSGHVEPAAIYFDMNPLRGPQALQRTVARAAQCAVFTVDTHNIVPVREASSKAEIAARTVRPKIHRLLTQYLVESEPLVAHPHAWPGVVMPLSNLQEKIQTMLAQLPSSGQHKLHELYPAVSENAVRTQLADFIEHKLGTYHEVRNDPTVNGLSGLSPYLHFGRIASLRVVLEARAAVAADAGLQQGYDVLVEELVVRKELSDNYCYYNTQYDNLSGAPNWAQATLDKHRSDHREHIYSAEQFTQAETHDPAWNAAQQQLVQTGKMHGYMRMYWAKKVLEWSRSPEEAIETLVYLNDRYSLDGGDPNGYVGILWSVAGLHDRPWAERPVYGTIRSMVYTGLRRKFSIEQYEQTWGTRG